MITKPMHRQIFILATAQALFQTVSVAAMIIGALAGAMIANQPEWATVPVAAMFLGTAIFTFPASMFMARTGRQAGFLLGAMLGVLGGMIGALGIWLSSLPLLSLGTFFVGAYQAFAQFYRFAASEAADDAFRPHAISLVLGGGIIAAFLGPALVLIGVSLTETTYVGSFLLLALGSLLGIGALLGLKLPEQAVNHVNTSDARPWKKIVSQPAYLVALFSAATGYGVMILGMTATPIAMTLHHHDLTSTTMVVQFHVLGMFLPSFFTGSLIARFGVLNIMLAGVLVLVGYVFLTWSGTEFSSFAGALIMLGIGWNFLYIGGTTLLTETYRPAEKSQAQAINDMTIFTVGLACSLSAGGLLVMFGWQMLNGIMLPWLGIAMLALIWLTTRTHSYANEAPEIRGLT